MSGHGDLENLILSTVERVLAGRRSERHGLVTSYDPDKHLAKVAFMPEGQESGWLPIETDHIGDGFGIAIGLTPGDGKKTGDQVIVRYQEGDFESGKIAKVVHSDKEKPPRVESGEIVLFTKFKKSGGVADGGQGGTGQQIYFKKDGSITITDGNGGTWALDGKGNHSLACNNHTIGAKGDRSLTINGKDTTSIGKDKAVTISGKRTDTVSKFWNTSAAFGLWAWLTSGSDISDG
jgi:uncharacterized protein involved in type VI secretion and phage assembly